MKVQSIARLFLTTTFLLACVLSVSGCSVLPNQSGSKEAAPAQASSEAQPYSPNEFTDLLIPSELKWSREKSMLVRTESFAGGILVYSGRVEIASLADFFTNNMAKNGWKLAGSAKYKDILLAFVKPGKTCTITITDKEFGLNTEVNIYITEDKSGAGNQSFSASSPK